MAQISQEIIIRFINNTCSDEEVQMVKLWLDESDENYQELFELERIVMLARDTTKAKERVSEKIRRKIIGRQLERESHTRRNRLLKWVSAAAAIVVIAIASIQIFKAPDVKMLKVVAISESRSVVLPDGTTVYLNSGSQLEYPEKFASTRKVSLTGEGFFKVTHDSNHPFVVEGDYLTVKVLGTEFNFNSNENGINDVSLIEGSVEVSTDDNKSGVILIPGQRADYDMSTGSITVVETNAMVDAAWHNKVIPFENATIGEIAEILSRLYNLRVDMDSSINQKNTYSGSTILYDDVDSTLSRLSITLPVIFKKSEKTLVIQSI